MLPIPSFPCHHLSTLLPRLNPLMISSFPYRLTETLGLPVRFKARDYCSFDGDPQRSPSQDREIRRGGSCVAIDTAAQSLSILVEGCRYRTLLR